MPDLLSHSLAAYVLRARPSAPRRAVVAFVTGTVLPDVLSQVPSLGLGLLARAGARLPQWLYEGWFDDGWQMFHSLLPLALTFWLFSLFLPRETRAADFVALLGGGWLHLGLDFLQFHISPVSYFPLYPFSDLSWEAGLYSTEASLYVLPFLLLAAGAVALRRKSGKTEKRS